MYIAPDTNVRILKNCPLDGTNRHTLYFPNQDAQSAYFIGLTKYNLPALSYQRVRSGMLRVQINPDNLFDCNYLMFQNASFGTKWFYAYIDKTEYVNNITAEISYTLDVMQTWYFDYSLPENFVEREHVTDDTIGAHTVPENLETGPYAVTNSQYYNGFYMLNVCMLATEPIGGGEFTWSEPGIYGGLPMPCYVGYVGTLSVITAEGVAANLKAICDAFSELGKADAIICVFTMPSGLTPDPIFGGESLQESVQALAARTPNYTPKNNKLLAYPYTALAVRALGQASVLRYELFANPEAPTAKVYGGFGPSPQVIMVPENYGGLAEDYEHSVSVKNFPLLPWTTDYFQNWLAQNTANLVIGTTFDVIKGGIGVARGVEAGSAASAVSSLVGAYESVAQRLVSVYEHSILPDNMHGVATAPDTLTVAGKNGFYSECKCILPEYAKIIDDYFSVFGYKVNAVKVPNVHARAQWSYIKTVGCKIIGSIPSDDAQKICSIFDSGVTFWTTPANVGNYSLPNPIIGGV